MSTPGVVPQDPSITNIDSQQDATGPQGPPAPPPPAPAPSPAPAAPAAPDAKSGPGFWKQILTGALSGLAGSAGSKSFGGGLAGGAQGYLDQKQREFQNQQSAASNASAIKFRDLQSAHAAAQLTAEDMHLQSLPEEIQDAKEKRAQDMATTNQKNFGIDYQVIPNNGDNATRYLSSDPNGAHVPGGVLVGSKNLYIPNTTDDQNSNSKKYEFVKAFGGSLGMPVPSREDFNSNPAARRQVFSQVSNIMAGKKMNGDVYKDPAEIGNAVKLFDANIANAKQKGAPDDTIAQMTQTRDLLQKQYDATIHGQDTKRGKDTQAKMALKGTPGAKSASTSTALMTGTDPNGNEVAGTEQELQAAGVKSYTKMPGTEASKIVVARELTSPSGLFHQAAADMAALGEKGLGPMSGRMNEFFSGKLGSDPTYGQAYTKLHTDLGLLSTAIMQAHVGSRGSEGMMEHFKSMADSGHMDAATLKAALQSEYKYIDSKAARPKALAGGK